MTNTPSTSAFGQVTVGRLTLRETFLVTDKVNALSGVGGLVLTGQESMPPLTLTELRQRREDLMGLLDAIVPVVFTNHSEYNGFYQVSDVGANTVNTTGEVVSVDWNLTLDVLGLPNDADVESRLTQTVRQNDFGLAGERWHAPAIGAYAYDTGFTQPNGNVVRTGEAGAVTVYRGVPAVSSARWGIAAGAYLAGAAAVVQDGWIRSGVNVTMTTSGWSISNGLVSVASSGGQINVSTYSSGGYNPKLVNVSVAGSAAGNQISAYSAVAVLRNDPECVTVRLVGDRAPGRFELDLSLRRGSRFVEGYLQSDRSSTLAVWLATAETQTSFASSGYVTATANDAFGNRYAIGSAHNFAPHASGGISKGSSTALDFWIGTVVNGSAPASGDAAVDLRNQYIAAAAETTQITRR